MGKQYNTRRAPFFRVKTILLCWGIIILSAGYAAAITINFDTLADGTPLAEGIMSGNEYADLGVIFSVADTVFPPGTLVINNVNGCEDFVGLTSPNMLGVTDLVEGDGCSIGCNADLKAEFTDPVRQVEVLVFADIVEPPGSVQLIARDSDGNVVDQDEFLLTETEAFAESFTLSVASQESNISSLETQGVTGNNVCIGFDNLSFSLGETQGDHCTACPAINLLLL